METTPSHERRGILLMLVSVVFFAANVLLLRAVSLREPAVDGFVSTAIRGFIGCVFVWLAFRGRGFQPARLLQRPLVLMRGAVGAVAILLFYLTIHHLGAGRAVIINLTYPIFGAVLAAPWLGERLVGRQVFWMVVALAGLGVFLAGPAGPAKGPGLLGVSGYEILAMAGAVVAGLAVVLIRLLGREEHPSTIFASQCLWSLLAALPFLTSAVLQLSTWALGLVTLASLFVAVGQLALTEAFRHLSVATGSAIQMLLPVITAAGGALFFAERYSTAELVGALVALFATWFVVRARAVKAPLEAPRPAVPARI